MPVKVKVPPSLRHVTDPSTVEIDARNLGECIDQLNSVFPGIRLQLCNERGDILSGFDFYVNGMSTSPASVAMPLSHGDEIIIVPVELDVGG